MSQPFKKNLIQFKKSLGQNFIFDTNLLDAIVADSGAENKNVLEIGVGAATLTARLALKAKHVTAVEIDTSLAPFINETLGGAANVSVVYSDILKLTHADIFNLMGGEFTVVANLPYYITTPVIFHLLESDLPVVSMTVTVQKEVALRMTAAAGSDDYGALSLAIAARGRAKITRLIGRNMFTPAPNVDSAVVRLDIERPHSSELSKLIKAIFAMRRKTVENNLCAGFSLSRDAAKAALTCAGINPQTRAEQLDLSKVTALLDALNEQKNK